MGKRQEKAVPSPDGSVESGCHSMCWLGWLTVITAMAKGEYCYPRGWLG